MKEKNAYISAKLEVINFDKKEIITLNESEVGGGSSGSLGWTPPFGLDTVDDEDVNSIG